MFKFWLPQGSIDPALTHIRSAGVDEVLRDLIGPVVVRSKFDKCRIRFYLFRDFTKMVISK